MIDQEGLAILEQHLTEGARRLLNKEREQAKVGAVTIEFENDRVRVTRHTTAMVSRTEPVHRLDRLIVWLKDGLIQRDHLGSLETVRHSAGDVVWRDASHHQVSVPHANEHEVLIIELKDP